MRTRVGVVGAGNIGSGLCRSLLKAGFHVTIHDIRPEPLAALREAGATIAPDPGAVARACSVVFSAVLDTQETLAALQGPSGALQHLSPRGCIFVCSTLSPADVRHLAGLAAERGLRLLDCAVSGSREGGHGRHAVIDDRWRPQRGR